jgi:hypothetical protein
MSGKDKNVWSLVKKVESSGKDWDEWDVLFLSRDWMERILS